LPAVLGLLLLSTGQKVLADKRYPYAGMRLVRSTWVLTRRAAVKCAQLLVPFDVLSLILAPAIGWHFYVTTSQLIASILRSQPHRHHARISCNVDA